jgi:hypothetical protein
MPCGAASCELRAAGAGPVLTLVYEASANPALRPVAAAELRNLASRVDAVDVGTSLVALHTMAGDIDTAYAAANRLIDKLAQSGLVGTNWSSIWTPSMQSQDVAKLFSELQKTAADGPIGAGTWALSYLGLGDADRALHWLRVAVGKVENHEPDAGFLNLMTIKTNVHANPVLDETRFRELRNRIGALD